MVDTDISALITQRRRQIFVHSVIYYRHCTSIIPDTTFDSWAYELAELQRKYPEIAAECPFADEFNGFDGTTGYHLPYNSWALRKAAELIRFHNERVT